MAAQGQGQSEGQFPGQCQRRRSTISVIDYSPLQKLQKSPESNTESKQGSPDEGPVMKGSEIQGQVQRQSQGQRQRRRSIVSVVSLDPLQNQSGAVTMESKPGLKALPEGQDEGTIVKNKLISGQMEGPNKFISAHMDSPNKFRGNRSASIANPISVYSQNQEISAVRLVNTPGDSIESRGSDSPDGHIASNSSNTSNSINTSNSHFNSNGKYKLPPLAPVNTPTYEDGRISRSKSDLWKSTTLHKRR